MIPAPHCEYLARCVEQHDIIEPRVIYDIGACRGDWCRLARRLWPAARIIAFEANERMDLALRETADDFAIAVLSNAKGRRVKWHENEASPTGDSYYRECATDFYPAGRFRWRVTQTLDDVVKSRGFPPPDLVKIDVQGAELDIIDGGLRTLRHARDLIVELQHEQYNEGAALANVSIPYIERALQPDMQCVAKLFCNNGPDGDYHFSRKFLSEGKKIK